MVSLLYLKHAFNESDESLVERWSENVYWQFFSGMTFYEPKLPRDPAQISRFRRVLGEAGVEKLLKTTIEAAVAMNAAKPKDFERVIVDTTVQEKAIAHPTDSRLLEVAREKPARLTKRAVLTLWLERAERIQAQQPKDKNTLYALHAPEVECIGKRKALKPFEFGGKASIAISHTKGLIVAARSFPGNPYDGHTLAEQLDQATNVLQDLGVKPTTAVVDLGFRGVDKDIAPVQSIHRGKFKSLTTVQRRWLKQRQAVEPTIGHLKHDHRMDRCWLKGSQGDALHTVLCAAGFNIRWLMRAIARLGLAALLLACSALAHWLAPSPRGEMGSFLAGLAHQHRRGFNALAAVVR